jgi:hypothetical protein
MRSFDTDPNFQNGVTISKWANRYPDFQRKPHQARFAAADSWSDEILWISNNDPDPQRARNRIETRKWLAGCIKPRAYGPKVDLTVTE